MKWRKNLLLLFGVSYYTLDGVGPVDNRPPTDKLRQLVKEANKNKFVTHDMQHIVGMNHVKIGLKSMGQIIVSWKL